MPKLYGGYGTIILVIMQAPKMCWFCRTWLGYHGPTVLAPEAGGGRKGLNDLGRAYALGKSDYDS